MIGKVVLLLVGSFIGMKLPGKKTIVKVGSNGLQVIIALCREHEMSGDVACLDIAPAPGGKQICFLNGRCLMVVRGILVCVENFVTYKN